MICYLLVHVLRYFLIWFRLKSIDTIPLQDTEITDRGSYQLVAKSETGETMSQSVELKEEQVRLNQSESSL